MDDANFREKLFEILKDTDDLPQPQQDKIIKLARKSKNSHEQLQKKLGNLQQSLDYLRLGIKYLIFDLEATRRENTELRARLDKKGPNTP